MFSDILILILCVWGIISIFYSLIFRLTAWLTEELTLLIPVYRRSDDIHDRIYRIRSLLDFCRIKKKCTVVLVNYGAPEDFCNELREYYSEYDSVKIIPKEEIRLLFKE